MSGVACSRSPPPNLFTFLAPTTLQAAAIYPGRTWSKIITFSCIYSVMKNLEFSLYNKSPAAFPWPVIPISPLQKFHTHTHCLSVRVWRLPLDQLLYPLFGMKVEMPVPPHTFNMPPGAAALYVDPVKPPPDADGGRPEAHTSAVKLQKVYRSYRTRRRLADSAVVAEELWWQAIDYTRLKHSTISFFNYLKPESATSRWNRVSGNAAKIGKGAVHDKNALKLAFQHWIEAIDPRHRYGHNLHFYYEEWCKSDAGQPFFYWLDVGDGRDVDIEECPRSELREQCIIYLGPQEREHYEYVPTGGKLAHKQTGELLDTTMGSEKGKWIFVMSTSKKLYAGRKRKGKFHHSSFLAGGSTVAAGRLVAENGVIKAIWAYSGHYRPSRENLNNFLSTLRDNGVTISDDQIQSSSNEDYCEGLKSAQEEKVEEVPAGPPKASQLRMPVGMGELHLEPIVVLKDTAARINEARDGYQRTLSGRTLSGGLQSPRADVPRNALLKRINSKKEAKSYQLGHQLSLKWCTGVGPRIGCIADYPTELRVQALEFVNLSPRVPPTPSSRRLGTCLSPSGLA